VGEAATPRAAVCRTACGGSSSPAPADCITAALPAHPYSATIAIMKEIIGWSLGLCPDQALYVTVPLGSKRTVRQKVEPAACAKSVSDRAGSWRPLREIVLSLPIAVGRARIAP
jgi:hypothetical protein